MTKVWVLTSEYNDYDQHGEYILAVFANKPTAKQLMKYTDWPEDNHDHVLAGGGRIRHEYEWFNLRELEAE